MNLIKEHILTKEVFLNLLIFLMWGQMLLAYFRGFVGMLPFIGDYQYEAEAIVVTCAVIAALPAILNRMAPMDWLFLLSCLFIYVLNFGVYPNNYDVLVEKMFPTLCLTIPFFIMGRLMDIKKYYTPMIMISTLCIIMDAFYFLMYMRNPAQMAQRFAGEYYMHQAYMLMPHVMMMFWRGMKELSIWKLLIAILGMFLILAYGTRGPLGCLGLFCLVYFFFHAKFKYSMWIKSVIICIGSLFLVFIKPILIFLQDTLSAVDMSTRIIERMLTGGLLHDTGRGFVKLKLYEYLDRPDTFWGYGLFGCSRFGMKYPHDFFLDFFFSFGYMLGSILLFVIAYIVVKAYLITRSNTEKEFIVMFLCMTILKYFFSSTFIQEGFFFALLGFCSTILIRNKHEKQNSNSICSIQ